MWHCTTSPASNTSHFTRPVAIKLPWYQSALLLEMGSQFITRRCTTLTNKSSDRRAFGMALTTALLRMQLMSGGIIFDHVYGQIMDMWATTVTVSISTHKNVLFFATTINFWLHKVVQQHTHNVVENTVWVYSKFHTPSCKKELWKSVKIWRNWL